MCDGSLNEKMKFIRELMKIEKPGESDEYLFGHLTWTIEELKAYRDTLDQWKPAIV